MIERPDLFNAYIAASPVLYWDNNYLIKRRADFFKQNKDWKKTIFVGIGNEPPYIDGFNNFKKLLEKTKPKNFEYEFQEFKDDNHASVVLPVYYAGFRKFFAGWQMPANGSISDLENHFKNISKQFGYEILIPEETLNLVGYDLLNAKRFDEAISAFRKNVNNYPNSANVYDSLGEGYEKNGKFKQAAENYEKAFKIAEATGLTQLAKTSKANFERVSAKNPH